MTRLVALLRGVNVGRGNRIAMAQLRDVLLGLGHKDVTTHLNSGNAIFTSRSANQASVGAAIERALEEDLGVRSTVVIRSAPEIAGVVARNPLKQVASDPARYLVGFLAGSPGRAEAASVPSLAVAPDRALVVGDELYLWCPAGVLASALNKVKWDRQLGVAVTMRNWNTVARLAELTAG